MALSDIYYQQPWNPQAQGQQQMQQGLSNLAQMPMQQAQLQAQQQANTDAAYMSPARSANPYEQQLSGDVLDMLPGLPEHKAQLRAELAGQGGPAAPGQGLQAPMQGPQAPAPAQNLGPMGLGQPAIGQGGNIGPHTQRPYGPPQSQMPETSVYKGPLDDQSTLSVASAALGSGAQKPQTPAPPPTPVAQANAPQRVQAGTRGDVDLTMRMAPFMRSKKDSMEADKLAEKKREFDALLPLKQQAMRQKQDIAQLMARVRMATSDTDRKAQIAIAKLGVEKYLGELKARSTMLSGLGGVVNNEEAKQAVGEESQSIAKDEADAQDQLRQLRELESTAPGTKQKPRPAGGTKSVEVSLRGPGGESGSSPSGPELDKWMKANPSWTIVK